MKKRYNPEDQRYMKPPLQNSVNVLSRIYGCVYFPTYSNSLKAIAAYLGYAWTETGVTGLQSLVWRSSWCQDQNRSTKQRLLTYNIEDCLALKKVTESLIALSAKDKEESQDSAPEFSHADDIEQKTSFRFGKADFVLNELDFINKCAYFDYQRQRIYVKTEKKVKKALK